ncbi:hypothetical protein KR009_010469, partial [Drosophila setifemur]
NTHIRNKRLMANQTTYVPNEMDEEFDHFWEKVSCFVARLLPYEERCDFVQHAVDCNRSTNIVPYMKWLACDIKCTNKFQEYVCIMVFMAFCFEMGVLLFHFVFLPISFTTGLMTISKFLRLNEHLAGVTLLAFGNTADDLFVNLTNIHANVHLFANGMATGLFVAMVSAGLTIYIHPFKLNGYATIRDILFLILGSSLLSLILQYTNPDYNYLNYFLNILGMYVVYTWYLVTNVIDMYLLRRAITTTLAEIEALQSADITLEGAMRLRKLDRDLNRYTEDAELEIFQRESYRATIKTVRYGTLRTSKNARISVDIALSRSTFFNIELGKNRGLFTDFFKALKPFTCSTWRKSDMLKRTFLLVMVPVTIISTLYIPMVDYQLNKHGWNKLLNCLQVVLNPAVTIIILQALITTEGNGLWYVNLNEGVMYAVYSLIITVPLAVIILWDARTDLPPKYHWVFTIMNLTGSVFVTFVCATEIYKLLELVGNIMDVDIAFMGVTVATWSGSLCPLIANYAMASHGYPRMAFASAIGLPFFTIVICSGAVIHIRAYLGSPVSMDNQGGHYGNNAYIFLNLGLFCTLFWSLTLGFKARRSVGLFSIAIYLIYILFCVLINLKVIHSLAKDKQIFAALGDI